MRDSVAEPEGENLLLGVWLRTRKGVTEHAGEWTGHERAEPKGAGLGSGAWGWCALRTTGGRS